MGYPPVDLLKIGMDGESESVEVIDDVVSDEEMRGDFFAVFNHVHELLNGWMVAQDSNFCRGDRGVESGDGCSDRETLYESLAW